MNPLSHAKRIAIAIIGGTVVLIGIALIVLPGPAVLVIPAGLAILATEFAWAKRWLHKFKQMVPKRNGSKPPSSGQKPPA